jgi:hypothetical protein
VLSICCSLELADAPFLIAHVIKANQDETLKSRPLLLHGLRAIFEQGSGTPDFRNFISQYIGVQVSDNTLLLQ